MQKDLNIVQNSLNSVSGICYRVPFLRLMETFQNFVRPRQLYIEQPHVCALIYAKNAKRGGYTGFYKNIPKTGPFSRESFLKANALPGPNSVIQCHVYNTAGNR